MVGLIVLCLVGGVITWFAIYVATRETQPSPSAANYTLECTRGDDGRFLVEMVPEVSGARTWGATAEEAMAKAQAAALRILAQRLEQGEVKARSIRIELRAPAKAANAPAEELHPSEPPAVWRISL